MGSDMRPLGGVLVAVLVVLSGCVPALEPFYATEDLTFDPGLIGTWLEGPKPNKWSFARAGDQGYTLTHEANGERKAFDAHLFQLGRNLFLDLHPQLPVESADLHWAHYLPVHTVARVWLEGDTLRIAMLSREWLAGKIERDELAIDHRRTESGIVLTAPTRDLRALIASCADDADAFRRPEHCETPVNRRSVCFEPLLG